MSVTSRQVKNKRNQDGVSTARSGTVYDVYIRYKADEGYKTYGKRGFSTKQEALKHEAEMRTKLIMPGYTPLSAAESKQTVREYMEQWVENHGKANLRPSTFSSYKSHIRNHILPTIGFIPLRQLSPAMLDNMFQKLYDKGLSQSSVRYAQRILSVALEAARKYHYIETNPARDIITKFGKQGKTPDPYTIEQMQQLMANVTGTEWEMSMVLGGMYGMRRNEILGLRWQNVDIDGGLLHIVEQMPFKIPPKTTTLDEMAPVKAGNRTLPITDATRMYFDHQLTKQQQQKEMLRAAGGEYFENDLVVAKPNGAPMRAESVSSNFGQLIRRLGMPHIRFHDLRHTAATNMHQLTGDFYTVGEVLGHTLKGIGISLGLSTNLDAVTKQYVEVRVDRKRAVLDAYHNALHSQSEREKAPPVDEKNAPPKSKARHGEFEH